MNYADWYTDLVDVYRVQSRKEGALTKQERVQVAADIPCRVYRNSVHGPRMQPTAAKVEQEDKLACANEVDIQAGDELMLRRGAKLGQTRQRMRAFAGEPAYFYEPFGAVIPGLSHQELALLQMEYLKGRCRMALGDALQKRLEELQSRVPVVQQMFYDIAQGATIRAVEEATEHTPPNGDEKERGVGMITGELAQHWATDSQTVPTVTGGEYHTALANDVQYASYVNDGHRMDKHFVPGLIIDPRTGLLERVDPEIKGAGIMVGTKTSYVPGLYMKEKGVDKYKEVVRAELDKKPGEVLK